MPLEGTEVFHRRERFFPVSPFASEGNTAEVKEFTIAERTVKVCLLHFRLEYPIAFNSKSVSFGSILSLVSTTPLYLLCAIQSE